MKVYVVEVCCCDEYGYFQFWGVFTSEEKAHAAAKAAHLQCEDEGSCYAFRTDFYQVVETTLQ